MKVKVICKSLTVALVAVTAITLYVYMGFGNGLAVGTLTLTTDRDGYLAGEAVAISGAGFAPNEEITLQVTHTNGGAEPGKGHDPKTIYADANGAFTDTWSVDSSDTAGNRFLVTAVGGTSGASDPAVIRRIAQVKTDRFDYLPGETALGEAAGFKPFETVTLDVHHVNGRQDGTGHEPFTVTADANGSLSAPWLVDADDSRHTILVMKAVGSETGLTAFTVFTDLLVTIVDDQGADDFPGQKDLNLLSVDNGGLPSTLAITWNWDDTSWSGKNTGDACSLFDTNADGKANFSLCVTIGGTPAHKLENSECVAGNNPYQCCTGSETGTCGTRLYSCGDSRSDRCDQPTVLIPAVTSDCDATVVANTDPFGVAASPDFDPAHVSGNTCGKTPGCYTEDTVAECSVALSDMGNASSAFLINVCSYPSQEPNSDPSECVVTPNSGFLTIVKVADPNNEGTFTFNIGAGQQSQDGSSSWSINGSGSVNLISFAPGTGYDLSEVVPAGWSLDGASCVVNGNPTGSGTPPGTTGVTDFSILSGQETVCTFNDSNQCNNQSCDDNNPCTDDGCDHDTGQCTHTNNTSSCDDGDACTSGDSCVAGQCVGGGASSCDDGNACTVDSCDPATGCSHTAVSCDDGNACTSESCDPSVGCVVSNIVCDDGNACTDDSCNPATGCTVTPHVCNDGNACTDDGCNPSTGCTVTPHVCNDGNACTDDGCDPTSGCTVTPHVCNDGNACTDDGCDPTSGCTVTPHVCNDGNACTDDGCDPTSGCTVTPHVCNDGNACTDDGCDPTSGCTVTPHVCNDGNACTDDGCDPTSGCTVTPHVCNDGNACTDDGCNPSTGCTVTPHVCNDGNACTDDGCNPSTGCTVTPHVCNDGNACTDDGCDPTTGCTVTPHVCNDGNACTDDGCDPTTGCTVTPHVCNDGNACTDDGCNPSTGCTVTPHVCNDGNACTDDGCNPSTGCTVTPHVCNDGNACTDDGCNPSTGCTVTPHVCNDGNACTDDGCNPSTGCTVTPHVCNDGNACTDDGCDPTTGCTVTPHVCNDGNACTDDGCNPSTGCTVTPHVCNDGIGCTADRCDPTSGCYADPTGCSGLTDTSYCPLPNNQFRLIDVTDGTKDTSGALLYGLNSSNPGQFYYNVLYAGTPGSPVDLFVDIPYPFVTQGAVPIQIHDSTGFTGPGSAACLVPSPSLPGYTVNTQDDTILSSSGNPVILLAHPSAGDYDALELDKTTSVHVQGVVPTTGLLYVTIHLDYGLKKSAGWTKVGTNDAYHPAFSLADAALTILDGQVYPFSTSTGLMHNPTSTNVFKKNPGFGNLTVRNLTGDPKSNVMVQIFGPTGKLLDTSFTDQDGYSMFLYKHTGKTANYVVKLPDFNLQKTVTLKANGYVLSLFDTLP